MSSLLSIMDPQHVANIVFTTFSMSSFFVKKENEQFMYLYKYLLRWKTDYFG